MCVAVYLPKDKEVSKKTIENCWNKNPDGTGMGYVHEKKLYIRKGYKTFNNFYNSFVQVRKVYNSNMILHFRWKTHGKIDKSNCHPFAINKNIIFCHNGIINGVEISTEFSDTYMFNQTILKKMPKDFYKNKVIMDLIKRYSPYSKFIFLDNDGVGHILNESRGYWYNDIWFSNDDYKDKVVYSSFGYVRGGDSGYNYNNQYYKNQSGSGKGGGVVNKVTTKVVPKKIFVKCLCSECGLTMLSKEEKNRGMCYKCFRTSVVPY